MWLVFDANGRCKYHPYRGRGDYPGLGLKDFRVGMLKGRHETD